MRISLIACLCGARSVRSLSLIGTGIQRWGCRGRCGWKRKRQSATGKRVHSCGGGGVAIAWKAVRIISSLFPLYIFGWSLAGLKMQKANPPPAGETVSNRTGSWKMPEIDTGSISATGVFVLYVRFVSSFGMALCGARTASWGPGEAVLWTK